MRKKRILFAGEASFLFSGYSTYYTEVISRLYTTGKYDIAEFGCYATGNEEKAKHLPWKFYGNLPDPNNPAEQEYYHSNFIHQFGSWRFEEIALAFQPDIVVDIRDWAMMEFYERSPFRKYFHLAIMPAVDSIPQHPQWLSTYMDADSVLTYSDWGLRVLNECNGLIKTVGVASPGNDLNVFKPITDKDRHKVSFGLKPDDIVVGTVMRSQPRKLFPDLFKSFRMYLDQAPKELVERSYLYIHTSYPDWWIIPDLLVEHEISHRCLITYKCQACGFVFAGHFRDARTTCQRCGKSEALIPNTHVGLDRKQLAVIYNLFDVYVQYSNSGAFEIPIAEAAACGVHPIVVDYAAMEDFKKTVKATPINGLHFNRIGDSGIDVAIPDNQDFVNKLIKHLQLPRSYQTKKNMDARRGVEKFYTWDNTAKVWEDHFDSVPLSDLSKTWASPLKLHTIVQDVPINLPPEEFVAWCFTHIAGRGDLINNYMALRLLRDIQWKSTTEGTSNLGFNELSAIGSRPKRKDFSKADLIEQLRGVAEYANYWEKRRVESL